MWTEEDEKYVVSKFSSEIQTLFDKKDLKLFHNLIHKIFDPLTFSIVPLRSRDNTTIIKKPEKILQWWQQHFTNLFDDPSVIIADVLESLP